MLFFSFDLRSFCVCRTAVKLPFPRAACNCAVCVACPVNNNKKKKMANSTSTCLFWMLCTGARCSIFTLIFVFLRAVPVVSRSSPVLFIQWIITKSPVSLGHCQACVRSVWTSLRWSQLSWPPPRDVSVPILVDDVTGSFLYRWSTLSGSSGVPRRIMCEMWIWCVVLSLVVNWFIVCDLPQTRGM